MESLIEIIVPTFINAHLFWIIPKKDLLLRSAMNKVMANSGCKPLKQLPDSNAKKMVAVNINKTWARAILDSYEPNKYVCWLPDYGIMHVVDCLFYLPEDIAKCPHLCRQASLHNVVHLVTELTLGAAGYECKLNKTLSATPGVVKVALEYFERSDKLFFVTSDEDEYNIYGDIIYFSKNSIKQSLTDYLINKNLLTIDEAMCKEIERSRSHFKELYFGSSKSWYQNLDPTHQAGRLNEKLFNVELNKQNPSEYLERRRRRINNEIFSNSH